LTLLGSGCGGVDEMRSFADPRSVQWALARFEIGSGSFRRHKVLLLHVNGDDCPMVRRGHLNGCTPEVMKFLREKAEGFHASLELRTKADMTAEAIFKRVHHVFVSDDISGSGAIGGSYSIEAMLADYKKQIEILTAQRQARPSILRRQIENECVQASPSIVEVANCECSEPNMTHEQEEQPAPTPSPPPSIASFYTTGHDALKAVGSAHGLWNWVLVAANARLDLVAGGNGSVDEMRELLSSRQDTVLFGMLRLPFGGGRLQRVKHVFVQSIGEKTGIVQRGRLSTMRPQMRQAFTKYADCPVALEVSRSIDLSLESVVEKVRRVSVVDDVLLGAHNGAASVFSVEALRAGIEREINRALVPEQPIASPVEAPAPVEIPAAVESSSVPTSAPVETTIAVEEVEKALEVPEVTVEKAVRMVSQLGSQVNWVLFGLSNERLRSMRRGSRNYRVGGA